MIEVTLLVDKVTSVQLQKAAPRSAWFCPFAVYGIDPRDQTKAVAISTVTIEPLGNGTFGAELHLIKLNGASPIARREPDAPPFEFNKKYRFRVFTAPSRMIYFFQASINAQGGIGEYQLVATGTLDPSHPRVTLRGGWIGAYANDLLPNGKVFLSDLLVRVP